MDWIIDHWWIGLTCWAAGWVVAFLFGAIARVMSEIVDDLGTGWIVVALISAITGIGGVIVKFVGAVWLIMAMIGMLSQAVQS